MNTTSRSADVDASASRMCSMPNSADVNPSAIQRRVAGARAPIRGASRSISFSSSPRK